MWLSIINIFVSFSDGIYPLNVQLRYDKNSASNWWNGFTLNILRWRNQSALHPDKNSVRDRRAIQTLCNFTFEVLRWRALSMLYVQLHLLCRLSYDMNLVSDRRVIKRSVQRFYVSRFTLTGLCCTPSFTLCWHYNNSVNDRRSFPTLCCVVQVPRS